jgi:hypothetical protein
MTGKKLAIGLAAMTIGFYAATSDASPYLILGLSLDSHQTFYDGSNGTLAPEVDLSTLPTGTTQLIFSFTGGVITDGSMRLASPDGLYADGSTPYNFTGTNYGTGKYQGVRIGSSTGIDPAIMGVFFDPNFVGTPLDSLNYRSDASPDHRADLTYSPSLNQPFWIGDGFTGNNAYGQPVLGTQQIYNIPSGAKYLLLGIGADVNMADNQNSAVGPTQFTTSVPEPESYAMLLAGLGLLGFVACRRKQNAA